MDVRKRFEDLIRADGDDVLVLAGRPLRAPGEALRWEERLQRELVGRFLDRRPNATERTWHDFLALLAAEARTMEAPSEEAVEELKALIDGL